MARSPVAPTKSNLLAVKAQLVVARDGYDLLEQKRTILILELMDRLGEVKQLERDIALRLQTCYPALRDMLFQIGRQRSESIGSGVALRTSLVERHLVLAGLPFSVLDPVTADPDQEFAFGHTAAVCDRTLLEFSELLTLLVRMASLRAVVVRLALETKKTQRRVNALDKIVIPEAEETRKLIENALEEQEREAFFVRKLLKKRR